MRQGRKLQGWIGVFTAFVFAFQVFLATAVATQMAATAPTDPFAICHTIPEGTGDQPAGTTHAAHHPCTICSFISAGALPPPPVTFAPVRMVRATVVWFGQRTPVSVSKQRSPHLPQGPPRIA
ncbi:DUF2946 family protein [Nitrobacter sp.]|uniref:DUF2946 family protein n=1 Tax=Nitrobacter sp. TaxID=29420 RepID=UPI003F6505B7